jgi:hypothetical protein
MPRKDKEMTYTSGVGWLCESTGERDHGKKDAVASFVSLPDPCFCTGIHPLSLEISWFLEPVVSQLFVTVTKYLRKQCEGGRVYFGLEFQRLQSVISWYHCSRPVVRQSIMVEQSCSPHGSQEAGKTGRVWG